MSENINVIKLQEIVKDVGMVKLLEHLARVCQVAGDNANVPDQWYQLSAKLDKLADESFV